MAASRRTPGGFENWSRSLSLGVNFEQNGVAQFCVLLVLGKCRHCRFEILDAGAKRSCLVLRWRQKVLRIVDRRLIGMSHKNRRQRRRHNRWGIDRGPRLAALRQGLRHRSKLLDTCLLRRVRLRRGRRADRLLLLCSMLVLLAVLLLSEARRTLHLRHVVHRFAPRTTPTRARDACSLWWTIRRGCPQVATCVVAGPRPLPTHPG